MLSTPIFLEKKIQYDTSFEIPHIPTVVVPKKQGIYVFLTQNPFFTLYIYKRSKTPFQTFNGLKKPKQPHKNPKLTRNQKSTRV
jgi:hypothetical protein